MTRADKPLALTLGDPAGIGPDITLLAFEARRATSIPPFVLLGDPGVLAERASALGLAVRIEPIADIAAASSVFADALPVLPSPGRKHPSSPGVQTLPTPQSSSSRSKDPWPWSRAAPQAPW